MLPRIFLIAVPLATVIAWTSWPVEVLSQDSTRQLRRTESEQVEGYLKSLQLDELLIEHLEIETSREINLESRRAMASRLVEEYSQRMMSRQIVPNPIWQQRAELLLKTYPELETPVVRIAILQSKYLQGENDFRQWWDSGRNSKEKTRLVSEWQTLKSDLDSLNRKLANEYEDQVATLQAVPESRDIESKRLVQIEGMLLHTDYLIGWSAYFLGVLTPENRKPLMQTADQHFRSFLQIEPEKTLTEVSPQWIDFTSDWNARALVGLAMSQRGLNHNLQSSYCFDLISNHASNPRTRDLRFVWDLNSRLYLNEVSAAQKLVESIGEARHISEAGRQTFWMATLKAGIATRDQTPLVSRRLLRAGLTGLAREFEADLMSAFVEKHDVKIAGDDFVSRWIGGFLEFHQAGSLNQPAKYQSARTQLARALEIADGSTNPIDVARCKFLLARIQFIQKQYEPAAMAFLECSKQVNDVDPQLAAQSQWLAIRALSEHSRDNNPRSLIQATRAIDQIMRRFPGSTFAQRAEFEKLRISVSGLPAQQAIDRLKRIGTEDPNFPSALTEIAKIEYQAWLNAHQSKQETIASQSLAALIQTESEYRQLAIVTDESKLKTMLLVIDALLRSERLPADTIRQRLDLADALANDASLSGPIYHEYRYYEFLFASRTGEQQTAISEAKWLSENAKGTRFEESALIQLAQLADRQLKTNTEPTDQQLKGVVLIFERLVELLGSSEENLKSFSNARVAYVRLAELRLESGSIDEAIRMFETLNRIFPNRKNYLRQLALARTQARQFAEAILIWRKLVSGVAPGSELWIESKYYLATCLYRSGEIEDARQLHQQTVRLSPELPEKWKSRFDELTGLLRPD